MRPTVFTSLLALAPLACGTVNASATSGPYDGSAETRLPDGAVVPPVLDGAFAPDGSLFPTDGGFCQGSGPVISIPGAGTECTGDIGPTTFLFAVCSCADVSVSGTLLTDSVVPGSTTSGSGNGGSIGTNGALTTNSTLNVRGSVWSAASGEATAFHVVQSGAVFGDVHAGAAVQADQPLTIAGDLSVNGNAGGTISCTDAFLPVDASAPSLTASGSITRQPVSVAPPCDCTNILDVPAIVSSFATANDDATVPGLGPSSFSPFPGTQVALPCGRYYFAGADGAGTMSIAISGRTAIFVQGDFHAHAAFTLALSPGAELDLFITGNLLLDGDASLGDAASPARVRVYVGGDTLTLSGSANIGANLYAPHANVALSSDFEMAGSLFVSSLLLSGRFTVHYDESILSTVGCAPSGGACTSCHECSGATPACKGNACVPCVTDDDCCAPLHCSQGHCYDEIP